MENARASSNSGALRAGARIANSRGTVGTLGIFARTFDGQLPVIVTCQHVLFGGGGQAQEPWWSMAGTPLRAGRTRHGRRGIVRHDGADTFVDCATADVDPALLGGQRWMAESAGPAPSINGRVHFLDAAGQAVHGTVLSTSYSETVPIEGANTPTANQILIRSLVPGRAFNLPGDSGAALRNEAGAVIGLVWGFSASGDALACPIAPVLWVLNIELAGLQ